MADACTHERETVTNPDGSTSPELCTKCYKPPTKAALKESQEGLPAPAEVAAHHESTEKGVDGGLA